MRVVIERSAGTHRRLSFLRLCSIFRHQLGNPSVFIRWVSWVKLLSRAQIFDFVANERWIDICTCFNVLLFVIFCSSCSPLMPCTSLEVISPACILSTHHHAFFTSFSSASEWAIINFMDASLTMTQPLLSLSLFSPAKQKQAQFSVLFLFVQFPHSFNFNLPCILCLCID